MLAFLFIFFLLVFFVLAFLFIFSFFGGSVHSDTSRTKRVTVDRDLLLHGNAKCDSWHTCRAGDDHRACHSLRGTRCAHGRVLFVDTDKAASV